MQFIEKNTFDIRSAIYHLKKNDENLEFILFPMIHVGTKEYYDDICGRLESCDLILAEGVKSKKAHLLTLTYRIVKNIRRMDLITQSGGMQISSFRDKIIDSDMNEDVFDDHWSSLSVGIRALIFTIVPMYVIYLFVFGTRRLIAQNIALEDLPSRDETLSQDERFEKLDDFLIDKRDQKLIDRIKHLHDVGGNEKKIVGIVYGARHMRHVVNFLLLKWHYKIAKAEWVTVFKL
jgi:hypothetical protein